MEYQTHITDNNLLTEIKNTKMIVDDLKIKLKPIYIMDENDPYFQLYCKYLHIIIEYLNINKDKLKYPTVNIEHNLLKDYTIYPHPNTFILFAKCIGELLKFRKVLITSTIIQFVIV
jgi:hypothetical protein